MPVSLMTSLPAAAAARALPGPVRMSSAAGPSTTAWSLPELATSLLPLALLVLRPAGTAAAPAAAMAASAAACARAATPARASVRAAAALLAMMWRSSCFRA
jgi:hypothetical protein